MPRVKHDTTMSREDHIAVTILNGKDRLLVPRHINPLAPPSEAVKDILQYTGFWHVSQIGRMDLNKYLITALVERWRPETHTFHFQCGEVTVTLEDVALLFGLRSHGEVVTGTTCSNVEYLREQCYLLFGGAPEPEHVDGFTISLGWVQNFVEGLPMTQENILVRARAYILCLLGTVVVPDKSTRCVHGKYLQLLGDLETFARLSWGSACLAVLYRNLDRATRIKTKQIGGPLMLLQAWAWTRLPYLAPIPTAISEYSFPLAKIWRHPKHPNNAQQKSFGDHFFLRQKLDEMTQDHFQWQPYKHDIIEKLIPEIICAENREWKLKVALICFEILEWHASNRVVRQFGYFQDIPEDHPNLGLSHNLDLRGKDENIDWALRHRDWIRMWRLRGPFLFQGQQLVGNPIDYTATKEYMDWYRNNTFVPLCLIPASEDEASEPTPSTEQPAVATITAPNPPSQYSPGYAPFVAFYPSSSSSRDGDQTNRPIHHTSFTHTSRDLIGSSSIQEADDVFTQQQ